MASRYLRTHGPTNHSRIQVYYQNCKIGRCSFRHVCDIYTHFVAYKQVVLFIFFCAALENKLSVSGFLVADEIASRLTVRIANVIHSFSSSYCFRNLNKTKKENVSSLCGSQRSNCELSELSSNNRD